MKVKMNMVVRVILHHQMKIKRRKKSKHKKKEKHRRKKEAKRLAKLSIEARK